MTSQWAERVARLSENELLRAEASAAKDDPLTERRDRAREVLGDVGRKIVATIHERTAYSISVFGLVILGAVLGIVLRGSHMVVAFGISFVPSLVVIITIVAGRQMACNAHTYAVGLSLMWTGIAAVAALDWWTLARVLRR